MLQSRISINDLVPWVSLATFLYKATNDMGIEDSD